MRFLQKPESAAKDESDPKPNKKSRKKKPRQASEKEISRYFDAGGARLHDDGGDQKRHIPPHDIATAKQGLQSVSPVVSNLLEKPFLGFGSRGTHPPTTSYYSWSESGRESSAQARHFAPNLELLAAGQLQSSRARKQKKLSLYEANTAQCPSAEPTVTKSHGKDRYPISEHALEMDQAICPPAEPQPVQQNEAEETPKLISDKHDMLVTAAKSLVYQNGERSNSTKKDSSVPEAVLDVSKVDDNHVARSVRSRSASDHLAKEYAQPWEELLQNCELAARPLMPIYYEEGLARDSANAIQDRHTPATYGHADLRIWMTDIDDFPEHGCLDNPAFVSERVDWTQPEANGYQEDSAPFFEETVDDDSESLDSENGYNFPTENGVRWEEGDATQQDAVSGYRMREGEAMDELATFWQPNRLY